MATRYTIEAFGPTDGIPEGSMLLAEHGQSGFDDWLVPVAEDLEVIQLREIMQRLGDVFTEVVWATLILRTDRKYAGQVHHKPVFVGSEPWISDEAMVFVREALRPANRPERHPR